MSLLLLGLLAGLGVAMPLGAIGVLLIREGVTAGFRIAAAGAAAVALVDSAYCVLAVTVGSVAAPWVDTLGPAPQAIAGIVLVWLGASGLSGLSRSGAASRADDTPSDQSPIGAFARFAGLTAINPATLVYFFALTAALNTPLRPDGSLALFVVGVGVASALWQLGLAGVGAVLRERLRPAGHRLVNVVGSLIVLVFGMLSLALAATVLLET